MQVNLRVVILRKFLFHIKHSGVGQKTLFLKWRKHLSCHTNLKANRNHWNIPSPPILISPLPETPNSNVVPMFGVLAFFFYLHGLLVWYSNFGYWNMRSFLQFLDQNSQIPSASVNQCKFIQWQLKNRLCRRSIKPYINFSFIYMYLFFYFKKLLARGTLSNHRKIDSFKIGALKISWEIKTSRYKVNSRLEKH